MQGLALRSQFLRTVPAAAAIALFAGGASAAIHIEFTGMDLVYDGFSIFDAGSPAGGQGDPGIADPLVSVDIFDNGVLVGSLSQNISLDVFISGIGGIDAVEDVIDVQPTDEGGIFDILIGTGPAAAEYLLVDIVGGLFTFMDIGGDQQFIFGAIIGSIFSQNLPFGLGVVDPVTISFSAKVSTVETGKGNVTGFTAFGTGEYAAVPGPGAVVMGLFSAAIGTLRRRRR